MVRYGGIAWPKFYPCMLPIGLLTGMVLDPYQVVMYIDRVPNRNSPPAILLRESYRVGSNAAVTRPAVAACMTGKLGFEG